MLYEWLRQYPPRTRTELPTGPHYGREGKGLRRVKGFGVGLGVGFPCQHVSFGHRGGGALLAWCIHVAIVFSGNAAKIFQTRKPQTSPLGRSPIRRGL